MERHPFGLPDYLESTWHPQPCKLNLIFSHAGEWIKIQKARGDSTGPDYSEYYIGRLERYIDLRGIVRKAVAYGKDSEAMNTWYHFDDIKKALGTWVIPEVPYWYNNKKWNNRLRNEHVPKKEINTNTNTSNNSNNNNDSN